MLGAHTVAPKQQLAPPETPKRGLEATVRNVSMETIDTVCEQSDEPAERSAEQMRKWWNGKNWEVSD